jgi:hypothetical protein
MKNIAKYAFIIALVGFGLLTLFLSSSVIFDWFGIRVREGNYVLFIVWANFVSSIIYLLSAYGFIKLKQWTTKLLVGSIIILIAALIGLFLHVNAGGLYETKTVGAMVFRISVTLVFTISSYFFISKSNSLKKLL